jgi:hypothetical protein
MPVCPRHPIPILAYALLAPYPKGVEETLTWRAGPLAPEVHAWGLPESGWHPLQMGLNSKF